MSAPRVAYILLWFPEPTQTFILDEADTMHAQGLDVRVFTLYGPKPGQKVAGMAKPLAPIKRLGLAHARRLLADMARVRSRWGEEGGRFVRHALLRRWRTLETTGEAIWAVMAGVHLADRFQAEGITHIHAPWADGPATAAWVASRLTGIPFSFGTFAQDIYPPDGALHEKVRDAAMLRPSCLANQEHLSSLYPEHTDKMITIYAGSPLAPPPPPLRRPGSPFELLALGRFVPKKGYPVLIEACRILRDQGRDFHLTLAGDGRQAGLLRGLIDKHKLGEKVSLPGFVMHQQVPELFAKADLFVMSSVVTPSGDRDGIPTVIMEAMLHRVAVAGTTVSGIPEVVIPGRTGWLIPPGDANALAQALAEAMDNPDLTMRYAEAGRRFIRENFDSATNYGKLMALFEDLAAGRGDLKKYSSIG